MEDIALVLDQGIASFVQSTYTYHKFVSLKVGYLPAANRLEIRRSKQGGSKGQEQGRLTSFSTQQT